VSAAVGKVEFFDPEAKGFGQSEAALVQKVRDSAIWAGEEVEIVDPRGDKFQAGEHVRPFQVGRGRAASVRVAGREAQGRQEEAKEKRRGTEADTGRGTDQGDGRDWGAMAQHKGADVSGE
jgi:hypothetical protein